MAKMPRPDLRPNVAPRTIESLMYDAKNFGANGAKQYPWANRFVMGLPLAPWQREFKWDLAQCERFITSAWTGIHLGTYIVTAMEMCNENASSGAFEFLPLANMVVDGQQRLTALEMYLSDRLAVPDADGRLALWSDVDTVDQRRFQNTLFTRGEINIPDKMALLRFYDLLNFGGTPHEEHERALPLEEDNPPTQRKSPRP